MAPIDVMGATNRAMEQARAAGLTPLTTVVVSVVRKTYSSEIVYEVTLQAGSGLFEANISENSGRVLTWRKVK